MPPYRDTDHIRDIFLRAKRAVERRPGVADKESVTHVRVRDGLACEVEEGKWSLRVDMATVSGGDGSAPDPGLFGRATFGACMAIAIAQWAAILEVDIGAVDVDVHALYDARGYYGIGEIPPGYSRIRYVATLETDAPAEDIERVLEAAEKWSPWHDNFRRALPIEREVRVVAPGAGTEGVA